MNTVMFVNEKSLNRIKIVYVVFYSLCVAMNSSLNYTGNFRSLCFVIVVSKHSSVNNVFYLFFISFTFIVKCKYCIWINLQTMDFFFFFAVKLYFFRRNWFPLNFAKYVCVCVFFCLAFTCVFSNKNKKKFNS